MRREGEKEKEREGETAALNRSGEEKGEKLVESWGNT